MQRAILERLGANTHDPMSDWDNDFASWTSISKLAGSGERAKVESTRRAVLKLEKATLVEVSMIWRDVEYWYPRWQRPSTTSRRMLEARIPLEGDVAARWRAERDRRDIRARKAVDDLVALDRSIG